MVSHGLIEVSGQNNCLSPAAGGENFIAWTDLQTDFAVDFSGSNLNVESSISFTPNAGQKIAGSNDSTVCIQAIGEGPIQFPGSTSAFGPTAPGCDIPEEDTPTPTSTPVTPTSTPVTPTSTPGDTSAGDTDQHAGDADQHAGNPDADGDHSDNGGDRDADQHAGDPDADCYADRSFCAGPANVDTGAPSN